MRAGTPGCAPGGPHPFGECRKRPSEAASRARHRPGCPGEQRPASAGVARSWVPQWKGRRHGPLDRPNRDVRPCPALTPGANHGSDGPRPARNTRTGIRRALRASPVGRPLPSIAHEGHRRSCATRGPVSPMSKEDVVTDLTLEAAGELPAQSHGPEVIEERSAGRLVVGVDGSSSASWKGTRRLC